MPYLLIWITWLIIPKTLSGILLKIITKEKTSYNTSHSQQLTNKSHL
uniref:Uncharacterized protein n=1 Tax=Anguilla anguilla TaxID=7936 RepID=A0A0E9TI41_ANGAN